MKTIKMSVKIAAFVALFAVVCLMGTGCAFRIGDGFSASLLGPMPVASYDYDDGYAEPDACWYDGYEEVGYCGGTLMCWYGSYWGPASSEVVLQFDFYRSRNYGWEHNSYRNGHHSSGGHNGGHRQGGGSRHSGGHQNNGNHGGSQGHGQQSGGNHNGGQNNQHHGGGNHNGGQGH